MTVHIVGAGLSGLAAAVALAEAKIPVVLYEAAAQAGGRCRSYYDRELGRVIDNGNHLVLSGNEAVMRYLPQMDSGGGATFTGHVRPANQYHRRFRGTDSDDHRADYFPLRVIA